MLVSIMKSHIRSAVSLSVSLALMLSPFATAPSEAQTTGTPDRPQIVIAIGNSQSMDGDLSGAIMTGSGNLSSGLTSLYNSSSPVNYSVPSGFTPPMTPSQTASAPYTYNNNGTLVDNGASRLNVAKAGLSSVLSQYLPSMDFALEDYSTSGTSLYTTWVYYMSPSGGFTFANSLPTNGFTSYAAYQSFNAANPNASPPPTRWVNNPCYKYGSASSSVKSYCTSLSKSGLYGSSASSAASTLSGNQYMQIGASSDDPNVNDVLYSNGNSGLFVSYNGPNPASPYPPNFSLNDYENGSIYVSYASTSPKQGTYGNFGTSPTNAGYVPYSPQVVYAQRGFGYYVQSLNATGGNQVVSMTNLGTNPSTSAVNTALTPFTTALKPETNNSSSSEIKALAYQSPTAGLVQGAGNVLSNLTASCAGQYVILVTDGLPTMDLNGNNWPPLGSAAGQGYGVNAAFYGIAGDSNHGINDDSGNVPSGQTQGGLDSSKTNDQALIDTITAIQALNKKGIKTYVVGLGAGVDANANPAANYALNAMAIAGGTGTEYPANNVSAFNAALGSIAAQIFGTINVSAPVAPSRLPAGGLIYTATSNNNSGELAGHVQAFRTVAAPTTGASAPIGTASGPALWDVGDPQYGLMTAANRQANLYSTVSANSGTARSVATLAQMGAASGTYSDQAAFGFTAASPAIPNIQTILYYTWDPSYNTTGDTTSPAYPAGPSGYSYLAGRQLNWMLGSFSPNDQLQYLAPPSDQYLGGLGGYVNFARNESGRQKLVLFTSNDGFLYAVDSQTGKLAWGWMPREFVGQLQNYQNFQRLQLFDGGFTTTDAVDTTTNPTASNWASYVVGTASAGAYHYAIKLADDPSTSPPSPTPTKQTWGISTPGGSSPQMQAPIIATVNGAQYAIFVVNTKTGSGSTQVTTSTLYEVNVATGQPASGSAQSASLGLGTGNYVTSALNYDSSSGTLWFGDSQGQVWNVYLTGTATADAAGLQLAGATNPAQPINYVGYTEQGGMPYFWAATQNEVTVFEQVSGGSGYIVWASSSSGGYEPDASGTLQQASGVNALMGQVSAVPYLKNGVFWVPVYQPPTGTNVCGVGSGGLNYFNFVNGLEPTTPITYKGQVVTGGYIYLGKGPALSPTGSNTTTGAIILATTQLTNLNTPPTPITQLFQNLNRPILWRQY
ncbi:conserved exported hypothetical protein [Thiomonas sp. CB2]|nr:conserved exported hypothetical protein [Thiomonas sp. CB2]